jgi:enoyl-CoA hydratase
MHARMMKILQDAHALVMNMVNARKPIISAINGPAAGAGLAVALMADIPIAARNARLVDAHTRLGVAAGDHAAIIWPLLCGMAKAKYYLLTCDPLTGEEAERIGVVALCADDDKLMDKALEVATRLAEGPPLAIRLTKRALNGWLRSAEPHFDLSLAYEIIGFLGPELPEGASAIREKRQPKWSQDSVF